MSNDANTSSYVHFGGCTVTSDGITVVDCQIDSRRCPAAAPSSSSSSSSSNTNFQTGLQRPGRCQADDITVGKCVGEGTLGLCTPSGCHGSSSSTNDEDASCTLLRHDGTDRLTVYGVCRERYSKIVTGCFYRAQDCLDSNGDGLLDERIGEEYLNPDAFFLAANTNDDHGKLYCDCSDVRVGACLKMDDDFPIVPAYHYCAVDAASCGPGETFWNARQVMQYPKTIRQCRLCQPTDISASSRLETDMFFENERIKLQSSNSSGEKGEDANTGSTNAVSPSPSPSTFKMSTDSLEVLGIVLGGIIVSALIVLICWLCSRRGQEEQQHVTNKNLTESSIESGLPVDGKELA